MFFSESVIHTKQQDGITRRIKSFEIIFLIFIQLNIARRKQEKRVTRSPIYLISKGRFTPNADLRKLPELYTSLIPEGNQN